MMELGGGGGCGGEWDIRGGGSSNGGHKCVGGSDGDTNVLGVLLGHKHAGRV